VNILNTIKNRIIEKKAQVQTHVFDKCDDYGIGIDDVNNAILTAKLYDKLTDDPRGTRYILCGQTLDDRELFVVCRFGNEKIIIITCYFGYED
jgi:Domain of unknown function (DUF4258)